MPDNTYTWVVQNATTLEVVRVYQKKYALRTWVSTVEPQDIYNYVIHRFPPYGQEKKRIEIGELL